jgi:hypothetical protein
VVGEINHSDPFNIVPTGLVASALAKAREEDAI